MRNFAWNRFPIKKFDDISYQPPLWRVRSRIHICASLIHRKKMKTECSLLIPQKHT